MLYIRKSLQADVFSLILLFLQSLMSKQNFKIFGIGENELSSYNFLENL